VPDSQPIPNVDYPATFQDFLAWFPDDEACVEYLALLRWPDGFVCPACGVADQPWLTGRGLRMCRSCGRKTSPTAGTIFHRTRSPLTTWFTAMWLVTSQKNGVSALGLQRAMGLGSYETAWAWMHKMRRAMVRPGRDLLSGQVEVDESFIGGVSPGRLGVSTEKVPVMIAAERAGGRKIGRIRLAVASKPNSNELVDFACAVVAPGSTIHTDGAKHLRKLADKGYTHEYIVGMRAEDPDAVMPAVHMTATLLKRWLTGTMHYAVERHQLPYYLDEFTFRFNRRTSRKRGMLFYRLLQQAVDTDPQPLRKLLKPGEND
jgi:transposase-like protein